LKTWQRSLYVTPQEQEGVSSIPANGLNPSRPATLLANSAKAYFHLHIVDENGTNFMKHDPDRKKVFGKIFTLESWTNFQLKTADKCVSD
jgi:hypothetical protein